MTEIDTVLGDFIDAWNAGRVPDVDDHLARVPEADRAELAERIATWLEVAPQPTYDAAARAQIEADPALAAALAAGEAAAAPWGVRLRRFREQAGLAIDGLAERLGDAVGLPGERARTAVYLQRAEQGELQESRVSRRLVAALASVLGVDRDDLAPAWTMPAPAAQFYRLDDGVPPPAAAALRDEFDAIARAAAAPAPARPLDELDRLFLGGPEA